MEATKTITLHDNVKIIAQVELGENYFIPDTVIVFDGTIEDCLKKHPKLITESLNELK